MRNILNRQDVNVFTAKLKARHPHLILFIDRQVKSYLLKKENTFIIPQEGYGVSLWLKTLFNTASASEKALFKNQGTFGLYLKLNFSEECFLKYSSILAFASEVDKINNHSFEDVVKKYRGRPKKKRIKIDSLIQGRDFKYVTKIDGHILLVLLTEQAFLKEGELMKNCLGAQGVLPVSNKKMFSLRNYKNKPIMTIHVDWTRKSILDAKGVANTPPNQVLLNAVCENLSLKKYPRFYSEQDSNRFVDFLGLAVVLFFFAIPSVVAVYMLNLILGWSSP